MATGAAWLNRAWSDRFHPPHFAIWDEGGQGPDEPKLGDEGWHPIHNSSASVVRGRPTPVFRGATTNGDPGQGRGNGRVEWSNEAGFAGPWVSSGDTGWDGDLAGALNRHLRWESATTIDRADRLEIPLKWACGDPDRSPTPQHPRPGLADCAQSTPRANIAVVGATRFRPFPEERLCWTLGETHGEVKVSLEGRFEIPNLSIPRETETLIIRRTWPKGAAPGATGRCGQ